MATKKSDRKISPKISLTAYEDTKGLDKKSIMEARGYVWDEQLGKWT